MHRYIYIYTCAHLHHRYTSIHAYMLSRSVDVLSSNLLYSCFQATARGDSIRITCLVNRIPDRNMIDWGVLG